jgi:hypothetical protein
LSVGSECGGSMNCCPSLSAYPSAIQSGDAAITASKNLNVPIYPIQAVDYVDAQRTKCGDVCFIDPSFWNPACSSNGNSWTCPLSDPQCACTDVVTQFQKGLATQTGGQAYVLNDLSAKDIADKIQDIINQQQQSRVPALDIGASIPIAKNPLAVTIPVPVPLAGTYTTAYIYEWS